MIVKSPYGKREILALENSSGRAQCPVCPEKLKKGEAVVSITFNAGPTGVRFFCKKHAKELANEILVLLEDAE